MKRFATLVLAVLALCSCGSGGDRLVIIHTNDTHSHLDPMRDGCGGVIERAAFIDSVRHEDGKDHVLLLHAGDFNQGTSYYNILGGKLEADLVNAMGYDCICLGNHEFDNGLEDLAERLSGINCPVVCCNYDFSPFELGKYVKPCAVIEKSGHRIGVTGVLADLSSLVSRTVADRIPRVGRNNAEAVNACASMLRSRENCDIVIALTHIGLEEDMVLARDLKGVDFIIGGHSHSFIDEPAVVPDKEKRPVPIVTDGRFGINLGVLELRF